MWCDYVTVTGMLVCGIIGPSRPSESCTNLYKVLHNPEMHHPSQHTFNDGTVSPVLSLW